MSFLLSIIFPDKCPYCGKLLKYRQTACEECRNEFPNTPKIKKLYSDNYCIAPFAYDGKVRQAILDFKFRKIKFNAESLSEEIARAFISSELNADVVTYVPTSFSSQWKRGFDQSDLIARRTAKILDIPFVPLLKKTGKNKVQHELDSEQRRTNVIGVYTAVSCDKAKGKNVLLIDDICTTGSTLSECSKVLFSAGAVNVYCASAAMVE